MRKILAAVSMIAMMSGAAMAQSGTSTTDKPGASGQQPQADQKQSSPGATGAMQNESSGVATSPQDVQKQGGAATAPGHDKDSSKSSTGGSGKSQ